MAAFQKHISPLLLFTLLAIGILAFTLTNKYTWQGDDGQGYTRIIDSDGMGYYLYLPNIFLNQTIARQKIDHRHILPYRGGSINKYYVGTALSTLPFFGIGYITASAQGDMLNGYSPPFQKAISLAAIFYLLIGLLFVALLIRSYAVSDRINAAILLLLCFGTNLLTYAVVSPAMSHIYSFAFVTGFLYFSRCVFTKKSHSSLFAAAAFFGMLVLIRPIDGLVVFALPFLAGYWNEFKNTFLSIANTRTIGFSLFIFIVFISIQFIINYVQSGHVFVWSYRDEGFYFENPQIWKTLFSFRKGWFIYTPLAFISFIAMVVLFLRKNRAFGYLLTFFAFLIYTTASWWNWYYGPSFSQRTFVEFYALIAIPLAFLFSQLPSKKWKIIVGTACVLCVALNLIQNYQYQTGIISSWNMDFAKYRYTFLKTGKQYENVLGGNRDIRPYNGLQNKKFATKTDFEEANPHISTSQFGFERSRNTRVSNYSNVEFNTVLRLPLDTSWNAENGFFAEVSLDRYELEKSSSRNALFVVTVSRDDQPNYYYYTFKLNGIPSGKSHLWKTLKYSIQIPVIPQSGDTLQMYVWNRNKKPFYIDNFKVAIFSLD